MGWEFRKVKSGVRARRLLRGRVILRRVEQTLDDTRPMHASNSPWRAENKWGKGGNHTWPLD